MGASSFSVLPAGATSFEHAGARWVRVSDAAQRCGVLVDTFRKWQSVGCPALGGNRLSAIRRDVASERRGGCWFVSETDLEKLLAAFVESVHEFQDGGENWISAKLARERYGFNPETLPRWHRLGCPALDGQTIQRRPRPGAHKGSSRRQFYRESDLKRILDKWAQDRDDSLERKEGEITVKEAARRCGVTRGTLDKWERNGCPALGGRRLVIARRWSTKGRRRGMRLRAFISLEQVKAIVAASSVAVREFEEGGENWICASLAQERYGVWGTTLRRWYREKGVKVRADKLRLRMRRRRLHRIGGGGKPPVEFYCESDVKKILATLADEARRLAEPDNGTLPLREAAGRCGVHTSTFSHWLRTGCPWLGGRRISVIRTKSVETGGARTLDRVFIAQEDVDAIRAARSGNGATAISDAAHKPAETASDAGDGSPSGTHGNGERAAEHGEATAQGRPSARGRKIETDLNEDRRIFEAWKTGCHETKEALALALGKPTKHVKAAIDRHRKRENCQTLALEKLA